MICLFHIFLIFFIDLCFFVAYLDKYINLQKDLRNILYIVDELFLKLTT